MCEQSERCRPSLLTPKHHHHRHHQKHHACHNNIIFTTRIVRCVRYTAAGYYDIKKKTCDITNCLPVGSQQRFIEIVSRHSHSSARLASERTPNLSCNKYRMRCIVTAGGMRKGMTDKICNRRRRQTKPFSHSFSIILYY